MLRQSNSVPFLIALLIGASSVAQTPPPQMPPPDPAAMKKQAEKFDRWKHALPPVTGQYSVVRSEEAGLEGHTVYRPANLASVKGQLPIVAAANGGCRNTPIELTAFYSELASRRYLVIANGTDDAPFLGMAVKSEPGAKPAQVTDPNSLIQSIDWATAQNGNKGSVFYHKINTGKVALMGQSCGGIMALTASDDPRVSTTVVMNSGYFKTPMPMINIPALPWSKFHAPIAYFIGGPTDIAYQNANSNFADSGQTAMFIANLGVGHTGFFEGESADPRWVKAVVAWLDWTLKGDKAQKSLFVGAKCKLCTDPEWTEVRSKGLN